MIKTEQLIFIHGLEGSSQGVKAKRLRELFPNMRIPDFSGSLDERMGDLVGVLEGGGEWTVIGSSFGGLMGALYACHNPERVQKLVLLAPALIWPTFVDNRPQPVSVPVILYHGSRDELIPLDEVRNIAEEVFTNLTFHVVDDNHGLYKTLHEIDWDQTLGD